MAPPLQRARFDSAAANILNAKLPNGQYLIPSAQYTPTQGVTLGYDAVVQGPIPKPTVNQGIAAIDYVLSSKDRLSGRYYVQSNPTNNPFGAVGSAAGICPTAFRWQPGDFARELRRALPQPHLGTASGVPLACVLMQGRGSSAFPPQVQWALRLPGSATFPQFDISTSDPTISDGLEFGPSTSFGNGGMIQNQWEYGTSMSWVKGKHVLSVGTTWDHIQLNILNNNTNTDTVDFTTFENFKGHLARRR